MEKLYTLEEVAELSKLHLNTLYRHINSGLLSAYKIGNYYRVKETDLELYLYGKKQKED